MPACAWSCASSFLVFWIAMTCCRYTPTAASILPAATACAMPLASMFGFSARYASPTIWICAAKSSLCAVLCSLACVSSIVCAAEACCAIMVSFVAAARVPSLAASCCAAADASSCARAFATRTSCEVNSVPMASVKVLSVPVMAPASAPKPDTTGARPSAASSDARFLAFSICVFACA